MSDLQLLQGYTPRTGELAGSVTAVQMPNIPCNAARFKARDDNAGNVYIGAVGVTAPDGTTDTTTGFPLDAGDDTGWWVCTNLNQFWRISDNAGDDVIYAVS